MKKLLIGNLLTLIIILSAFGQEDLNSHDGWELLDEENYAIQYPEDWKLDKSGMMGSSFFINSPATSLEDDFSENVNLIIQNLKGYNLDLDVYTKLSESQIKTMIVGSEIIESTRMKDKQGKDFHKIIYTGKLKGRELKFEQYYWVENERAFVLTLTCEKSQFEDYRIIGEKILDSFTLKSTKPIPKRL